MKFHPLFGVSAPEHGWAPAPRYLLRRERILDLIEPLPRGRLLEIGCGAGALLVDFHRMGFQCTAMEVSPGARRLARILNEGNKDLCLVEGPSADWDQRFDCVLAFEVLEHIEDDLGALEQWTSWIAPQGSIVVSVPAHPKRWNQADVWAGHVRRYERDRLGRIFRQAGLRIERLECYGFPLANLVEPLRAYFYGRELRKNASRGQGWAEARHRTEHSGFDRPVDRKAFVLWSNPLAALFLKLAILAQRPFLDTDRGNGYLVLARRP